MATNHTTKKAKEKIEESPAKTGKQQANQFKPGRSGNPKGRPSGSRHKATLAAQSLLNGEVEALTRVCIEKALEGDGFALKLALERILPPSKDRPIQLSLPKINKPEGIVQSMSKVIEAVSEGLITPMEASTLAKILGEQAKAIEVQDHESRILALEIERSKNERIR